MRGRGNTSFLNGGFEVLVSARGGRWFLHLRHHFLPWSFEQLRLRRRPQAVHRRRRYLRCLSPHMHTERDSDRVIHPRAISGAHPAPGLMKNMPTSKHQDSMVSHPKLNIFSVQEAVATAHRTHRRAHRGGTAPSSAAV